MSKTPLYIFDLDGTLALIDHRRHFVERPSYEQDWASFYEACDKDLPNRPVLCVMETLLLAGADIWIFSGRSDEVRDKTIDWLAAHTSFSRYRLEGPMLTMRRKGDFTADTLLKASWYLDMLQEDRERLVAVFDDRKKVVDMWRSYGVACFQVADGAF